MTNSYTWSFQNFEVAASQDGLQDVVTNVWWVLTADDGAGHTVACSGTAPITYDASVQFTPFPQITPTIAETWVTSALGAPQIDALKMQLDQNITAQVTPPVVSMAPPWA